MCHFSIRWQSYTVIKNSVNFTEGMANVRADLYYKVAALLKILSKKWLYISIKGI